MNPTISASSLPGKCRPASKRQGLPWATEMVRQPSVPGLPVRARQDASSSSRLLCRAIFLLPENMVDHIRNSGTGITTRKADAKGDNGWRVRWEIRIGLQRVKRVEKQQTPLRVCSHAFGTKSTDSANGRSIGDIRFVYSPESCRVGVPGHSCCRKGSLPGGLVEIDGLIAWG